MAKSKKSGKGKQPVQPVVGMEKWLPWIAVAITAFFFLNSLGNGFVNWDDDVNILENPNLAAFNWAAIKGIFTSDVIGNYNPLTILTFAIEKAMFGLNPTVFHVNNLLLHMACVFLVYRILQGLGMNAMLAFIGALIFGIHPMRVESVSWITERKDVLFGVFYLGALLTYIRYLDKDRKAPKMVLTILVLFALSLLSKIQAVTLPLSMLCVDYLRRRPLKLSLLVEKWPYFLLSLAVGLLGVFMLSANESLEDTTAYSLLDRLMVGMYSYSLYLVKFIVPYRMSPLYPYEAEIPGYFYASPIGIIIVGYLAWRWWKNDQRAYMFGIAFFTFNVMFLLQILAAGQGYLADRFTYIPYLGLIFMLLTFIKGWMDQPRYAGTVKAVVWSWLLVLGILTFQQNKVWANGGTLWTHVLKYYQNINTPYNNRARYYRELKDYDKAIKDYDASLALKEKGGTYNSRGKLYFDQGKNKEALADYTRGIEVEPDLGELYVNRAAVYGMLGNLDAALKDVNRGLELDPDNANGYLNRSLIYINLREFAKAELDHTKYLDLKPNEPDILYERGLVRVNQGKYAEALEDFNKAIQLNNTQGVYYQQRARALQGLGRTAEAADDIQKARNLGVGN